MRTPDPSSQQPFRQAYFVVLLVTLTIVLVATIGQVKRSTAEVEVGAEPVSTASEAPAMTIESMTCFTCHSLTTYAAGGDGAFPHELHMDVLEIEGCHDCHAFEAHRPVIERMICAECH